MPSFSWPSPCAAAALLDARAAQDVFERVISLVAGVFEDLLVAGDPRILPGPRPVPCRRILDRESVEDGVRIDPREPFDNVQVLAGAFVTRLVREVGRVDDERVAFPTA